MVHDVGWYVAQVEAPVTNAVRGESDARARNEETSAREGGEDRSPAERIVFVCECANPGCTETVGLSAAEYEAVRSHPAQFVVRPGHEGLDRVIARSRSYVIVEKLGAAGDLATALE